MAFQNPKGTRDFYPSEMGVRRYIEDVWRAVSVRHGFVEVDGPTFEMLDLYKVKSGDEIVSQLFCLDSKPDKEGKVEHYALRPEFTPTLARMVAAKANALPRPIKWFSIPRCYRGENVQKGRLREFIQWNADVLGGDTPEAKRQFDLECAALCLDGLREFGLVNGDVKLLWNDRQLVERLFELGGVAKERFGFAFYLLDRVAKLVPEQRAKLYGENGVTDAERGFFEKLAEGKDPLMAEFWAGTGADFAGYQKTIREAAEKIEGTLGAMGLGGYAKYDASIVRGLAYYTGFVWEVADARGTNRAVAGGGRYDKLIEMFGGPSLPAVGFGMGDVVLAILLEELGKMPAWVKTGAARADVYMINALEDGSAAMRLMGQLRESQWDAKHERIERAGIAVATSYKATKNIGKIMPEASASGARLAVILAAAEMARGVVKIKDLLTRHEEEVAERHAVDAVRGFLRPAHGPVTLHEAIKQARQHSRDWAIDSGGHPLRVGHGAQGQSGPRMQAGAVHLPIGTPGVASGVKIHGPGEAEAQSEEMRRVTLNDEEAMFLRLLKRATKKE